MGILAVVRETPIPSDLIMGPHWLTHSKSPQAIQALGKAGARGSGLSSRTVVPSVSLLLLSYCQFHPKADLPCDPQKC